MANAIELNLSLPEESRGLLLRQSVLKRAVSRHTRQLVSLYYDTPAFSLQRRGIVLCLRKQGRDWLQTVRYDGARLSCGTVWETPYFGHFDFTAIDDPEMLRWLERSPLRTRMVPLFEVSFHRTTWRFEPAPGCVFHLKLDRGWIAASGRREPISELALELESGEINEIFKMALLLAERLPLAPQSKSKIERGYSLFLNAPPMPVKAQPVAIGPDCSPLASFRQIAFSCLEHQQANFAGALNSDNPEFIHQMRVSIRRLRAAMRLFAPRLPPDFTDELLLPLRQLMDRLGRARDLDVLLSEIVMPVMNELPDEPRLALLVGAVTDRQYAAREAAERHLRSVAYGRLMILATALLHRSPFIAPDTDETLVTFAAGRLRRLRKKVLALAEVASIDDPASLHSLRIGIKRLRYAMEFFAPLCAGKSLHSLMRELVELQEELGQLNDLANAGMLLMHCAGDDPRLREAVSLVGGWHAARYRELLARMPGRLKALRKLSLPALVFRPADETFPFR